jgi:hypothetical protein
MSGVQTVRGTEWKMNWRGRQISDQAGMLRYVNGNVFL